MPSVELSAGTSMKAKRKKAVIVLSTIIILGILARIFGSTTFLTYSHKDRALRSSGNVPLNGLTLGWVDDVNDDSVPDLAVAYRERALRGMARMGWEKRPWKVSVYSGKEGELIQIYERGDPELVFRSRLNSNGSVETVRFLVTSHNAAGTLSKREGLRPLNGSLILLAAESFTWYSIEIPLVEIEGMQLIYDVFDVYEDSIEMTFPKGVELFQTHMKIFKGASDAEGDFIAALGKWEDTQSGKEAVLGTISRFAIPGGELLSTIDLRGAPSNSYAMSSIATYWDKTGDGIDDWLIFGIDWHEKANPIPVYAWFDGRSGEFLEEYTQSWNRHFVGSRVLYSIKSAMSQGLLQWGDPTGVPGELEIIFRDWDSGKSQWALQIQLPVGKRIRKLHVTEFPDLDGDSFPDFGLVAESSSPYKSPLYKYASSDHVKAFLISGATGLPLKLPSKE